MIPNDIQIKPLLHTPQAIEQWKPVVGFEGRYDVSNLGNVRTYIYGKHVMPLPSRLLKPSLGLHGYLMVPLRKDGKSYQRYVHHLVTEAFHGPRPVGALALHTNDDPLDNRVSNLRWGTRSDNLYDAIRNGKMDYSKLRHRTKGRVCSVPGCGKKHRRNGYCATHSSRVRTHGSPEPRVDALRGEQNPAARLTQEQAARVKYSNERVCDLARELGAPYSTIQAIRSGKNWRHL